MCEHHLACLAALVKTLLAEDPEELFFFEDSADDEPLLSFVVFGWSPEFGLSVIIVITS